MTHCFKIVRKPNFRIAGAENVYVASTVRGPGLNLNVAAQIDFKELKAKRLRSRANRVKLHSTLRDRA